MESASAQKTPVIVNTKHGVGVLSKIADCVRMCFSSARNRRSARTGRRPRKTGRGSVNFPDAYGNCGDQPLRARRAPTVFSVRMESASATENAGYG